MCFSSMATYCLVILYCVRGRYLFEEAGPALFAGDGALGGEGALAALLVVLLPLDAGQRPLVVLLKEGVHEDVFAAVRRRLLVEVVHVQLRHPRLPAARTKTSCSA
jgi:hypothetical protein